MKKIILPFLLFSISYSFAQQANDCIDAIIVCGNTNISSNATGFGTQELDGTNACLYYEENSLWLSLTIGIGGNLAFNIIPNSRDLVVDYDFYVFGPNNSCGNLDDPIRCNTTNPLQAGLSYNQTGLRDSETNFSGGPAELGNGYVSSIPVSAGEHYYILIDRPVGTGGFTLEWTGTSGFLPMPNVTKPDNIQSCTTESNNTIDLTTNESQINTNATNALRYFTTYEDAFDDKNAINNTEQFSYFGITTPIFVRATNPNGCFEIVDFLIEPFAFDNPPNLSYSQCDNNGDEAASFSITQIETDIKKNTYNSSQYNISLHANESHANQNTNPILSTTFNSGTGQIYARVSLKDNSNCVITYPIKLILISAPGPKHLTITKCDVDDNSEDGFTLLNLEEVLIDLPHGSVTFYESNTDLLADNSIQNPTAYFNTTAFNAIIYYKIITATCENTGEVSIKINSTAIMNSNFGPLTTCDDDPDDNELSGTFNIDDIKQSYYNTIEVSIYANYNDASAANNAIKGNYRTTTTTLYVVYEGTSECLNIEKIDLVIQQSPMGSLVDFYEICSNELPLSIDGPIGFDTYLWYKWDGNLLQELSTTEQVSITEEGTYLLEIGTNYDFNRQTVSCTRTLDFEVVTLNGPVIEEVLIENNQDTNTIEIVVEEYGDYEYSIDKENYQAEPRFYNLESGAYTVYVSDKNGCGISEEKITLIGFPKFFTPNGDGINDIWQITGTNSNFTETAVNIFDRYGKLVIQINTDDIGWDGSIDGLQLPSSDYWFRINLINGEVYQGHFALKR